jgi:glycosyltransferase involved in cell wall biosynthesis
MSSPRILFLDHTASLGGAELYLFDLASHYRATSAVVLLEDGPFREKLEAADIPTCVIAANTSVQGVKKESRWWQVITALPEIFRLTVQVSRRARRYDVLYANSQKSLIVGALAGWLAQRPVVWNLHDMLTADHFSSFNRRLAVFFANQLTDRVIVNSEATRTAFVQSGGNVAKTGLVYNGIDVPSAGSSPSERASAVRHELNLGDSPLVGMFSRLAPWKGQHVLLRALPELPGVHALVVGDALFRGDHEYATALQDLACELGVDDRVHFLGFRTDVFSLMQSVDVVVHASTSPEPFGRVLVEAQLAETPVIATAAGGALEIIRDGETGWLIPPEDSGALARAVQYVITNSPVEIDRILCRARRTAEARFSKEAMLEAVGIQLCHVFSDSSLLHHRDKNRSNTGKTSSFTTTGPNCQV